MKSIAQIVQNNLRLLAAYEDKVQPRFLSRYAREPMDAAAVYRKLRALDPGPDAPARGPRPRLRNRVANGSAFRWPAPC
ncbi:hypothetical protein HMPREF2690_00075 [Corynebacterium sp. HMSC034E11]|nr:hypothetical protein HMPREF2690_00075 [Corynebacterium sp. HMSC034E11]